MATIIPSWVIDVLEKEDAESKQGDPIEGRKYRLAREDWGNVVRIKTEFYKEHRHSGIAYIYTNLYAVLADNSTRPLHQIGAYKYNDRKWERDEEEKAKMHAACKSEAQIYKRYFESFFKQQKSPAVVA